MASMNAVRIHAYGGTESLVYEEAPRPRVGEGDVLVRVVATAVSPFDVAARAGYLAGWYSYTFPLILGLDVAGVVEEVGAGVADFAPGDAVYGRTDPGRLGAYAEYVVVAVTDVAPKPQSLDFLEAASLPHAGLSAWRALIDAAGLKEGQTVLIHAAAGGVGSCAVQLAKSRSARVIGTASTQNQSFLHDLGVDQAIDYTAAPFEEQVRDIDVVLDLVGGDTQERSWKVLRAGGVLMSMVQPPSQEAADAHGVRQQFVSALPPANSVLVELTPLVDSGRIKPVVSTVLPLEDIRKAHELIEGRHTRGKIVLRVAD
jgi:NADPH:quinone reductase-like Zn-dependent oxidoreductase